MSTMLLCCATSSRLTAANSHKFGIKSFQRRRPNPLQLSLGLRSEVSASRGARSGSREVSASRGSRSGSREVCSLRGGLGEISIGRSATETSNFRSDKTGFSTFKIPDAGFCNVLVGASVAARVVIALSSQRPSSNNDQDHDHHHSHDSNGTDDESHQHSHSVGDHAHSDPDDREDHDGHSHDHSHHGHGHGHSHSHTNLNAVQKLIQRVSKAVGIAAIADAWRENLTVVCVSSVLLLLGALAPFLFPNLAATSSLQTLLVVPALPLTGVPALLDASIDVAGGKINIHVLMAFAALASVFMGNALEGGLLLAMFSLSHLAEDYFTEQAMVDVKALKDSNPESALVLDDFDQNNPPQLSSVPYKQLPLQEVAVGSYILVKAGEVVPVDGEVYDGKATVTVEHLTGEATPVEKQVGDTVPGGARNLDGIMIVKATKVWSESTVARIMKLTEEAQSSKPKLERWLDEFTERYSQLVVAMSVAVAVLGPFVFKWPFLGSPGVRGSLYRALGIMVAASPCALAVAPLAYATAISACARKGILLKGGEVLDALAACDTVAFDKTGTLTTGELRCKAIEPLRGHQPFSESCCSPSCETEALAVAAAMERGATHPIARAVVDHSVGKHLPAVVVDDFEAIPGQGLTAKVSNLEAEEKESCTALLGSLDYVASSSKSSWEAAKIREAASNSGYSKELVRAALSVNRKVTLFHFEDQLRDNAATVVEVLKERCDLRVLMLTGDNASTAKRVAKSVGIDEFHAGLKPEDKLNQIHRLSQEKKSGGLVMVGDGINDAPALAAATVGIVLAQNASATAVQVADVLLLQNAIDGVPFVIAKAHQTTSLVKQSVGLALFCIFLAGLPSLLGYLPLWLTVLLHEGGTLLVCVNSVRALNNPSLSLRPWPLQLKQLLSTWTTTANGRGPSHTSTGSQPAPIPSS